MRSFVTPKNVKCCCLIWPTLYSVYSIKWSVFGKNIAGGFVRFSWQFSRERIRGDGEHGTDGEEGGRGCRGRLDAKSDQQRSSSERLPRLRLAIYVQLRRHCTPNEALFHVLLRLWETASSAPSDTTYQSSGSVAYRAFAFSASQALSELEWLYRVRLIKWPNN